MRKSRIPIKMFHSEPPPRCLLGRDAPCEYLEGRRELMGWRRYSCVLHRAMDGRNARCNKYIKRHEAVFVCHICGARTVKYPPTMRVDKCCGYEPLIIGRRPITDPDIMKKTAGEK